MPESADHYTRSLHLLLAQKTTPILVQTTQNNRRNEWHELMGGEEGRSGGAGCKL